MTKNNEPQDELKEALAELGSDKSLADNGELQAPLGQSDVGSPDNWAENKGSESVEEAFLALIQSNKTEDGIDGEVPPQVAVPGAETFGQPEEQPAIFSPDQSPLEENLAGDLHANPFAQSPENLAPQNPFGNEPQVTTPEPVLAEITQEEPVVVSETDERSLTEALSETIAQSLAEIHTSETIEEELVSQPVQNDPIMQSVAMQSEPLLQEPVVPQMQSQPQPQSMQPEMLFPEQQPVQPTQQAQVSPQAPAQPPMQGQQSSIPEFPGANPLDNYPLEAQQQQPAQQIAPVEDLIADMAAVTSSEIKIDSNTNNNDVMNQHHAYSNPFEAQKPQPAQVPPQVPVTHVGGTVGEGSQAAKMSAPVPVELAGTGGNNKSNADPEFQALVQWSNSDVEPSHHGPHDMPNFLSQKREEESKFSIKTVFLSIGISVIVIGMFYVGYQAGSGGQETGERVVDVTPRAEEPVRERRTAEAERMFENNQGSLGTTRRAAAPVKPEATITVFNVANLKGQAGRTIPMNIRLEGRNLGQETMLLLRGIPNQISLTTGIKREGVWSVPISELRKLALNVPSNYKGNFDFEVFAFKDKESGPEHRLASVRIDAMPKPVIRREPPREPIKIEQEPVRKIKPPVVREETKPRPPVRTVKPKAPLINPAVEAAMLKRANSLLRNGDVAGARLVFEHVAVMGSKHAAYALARTYERPYLEKLNIIGVVDDINLARKWYKKAADMGHAEAAARLQQIGFAQ